MTGNSRRSNSSIRRIVSAYKRSGERCGICGGPIDLDDCVVDHIIPLARGGSDGNDNLQLAHLRCNRRKRDMLPEEFAARQEELRKLATVFGLACSDEIMLPTDSGTAHRPRTESAREEPEA